MTHTTESLMELRKLAEAATEGPWIHRTNPRDPAGFIQAKRREGQAYDIEVYGDDYSCCGDEEQKARDMAYGAAFNPTKVIELLDAITELVAERDALAVRAVGLEAEVLLAKSIPMKYKRMEFNAQLRKENDTLRAQLDALQNEDELPELPPVRKLGEFYDGSPNNGYLWKDLEAYARQAQAMARAKLLAELGKVEAEAVGEVIQPGVIRWAHNYPPAGTKLYTRPQPAQDVNAELGEALQELLQAYQLHANHPYCQVGCEEDVLTKASSALLKAQAAPLPQPVQVNSELVEALSSSCHTEHLLLRGEVCRCSQCEFVRLRDTALANVKSAQQKEQK